MLAHLSSKDKQPFFSIKPTVIDKLISKNKSSIQNSLLYKNEDSDGSVSEDSEGNSSSSREHNLVVQVPRPAVIMAPVRKKDKDSGLEQKISPGSKVVLKRGRGRPPKKSVESGSNLKVIAAKKLLESSKRGAPKKKVMRDLQPPGKVKKDKVEIPPHRSVKRVQSSLKKDNLPSTAGNKFSVSDSVKPIVKKRKRKELKNIVSVETNEHSSHRSSLNVPTALMLNNRSSPRKFPNNMDRWKSTGFVIRGRGRGQGRGTSRGSLRGRPKKGNMRSERYNTRDSQTGLMRSGKKRKCSDSIFGEGLSRVRRSKKIPVNHLLREKLDCPSDEQSSFVTTSELSFCENENSLKQSDEESINLRSTKIKVEVEDDETTHSRDTNSNVYLGDKKFTSVVSTTDAHNINQSNNSKILNQSRLGESKFRRGRKRLLLSEKTTTSKSDASVKDSDCSLDSDFTTDVLNTTPVAKRHRRKGVDWVRRSTRSIGKTVVKVEQDNVVDEELLKESDFSIDLDSNSKSSSNIDYVNLADADSTVNDISKQTEASRAVIQTPLKENKNPSIIDKCRETDNTLNLENDLIQQISLSSANENTHESFLESDPSNNFSLVLEETPVKDSVAGIIKSEAQRKLVFNSPPKEEINVSNNISTDNSTTLDGNSPSVIHVIQDHYLKQESSAVNDDSINTPENTQPSETCVNHISIDERQIIVEEDSEKTSDNLNDEKIDVSGSFGEKTDDALSNNREQMSDEKILSLIDSFCQSDSNTDLSIDSSQEHMSSGSKEIQQTSIICESIVTMKTYENIISLKSEEQLKEACLTQDILTEKSNTNTNHQANELISILEVEQSIETKQSIIAIEGASNSTQVVHEIYENAVDKTVDRETTECPADLMPQPESSRVKIENCFDNNIKMDGIDNNIKMDGIDNNIKMDGFDNNIKMDGFDNNNIQIDCFDNNIKMDVDLDSTDKAPESSEESSSDTNSNMSEILTSALETDAVTRVKNEETLDENRSEISVSGGSTQLVLDEPETSSAGQSSSEFRTDSSLKEINNEDIGLQGTFLSKSGTEERPSKELLSALGLQSLHSVSEEKPKRPNESYTGTLKAVIKLNRSSDKKGRKIIFKQGDKLAEDTGGGGDRLEYRICNAEELATEGVPLTHLGDIPANRKAQVKVKSQFDLSNSPNIVGASGSMDTSVSTEVAKEAGGKQNLVIPEKSSSFSIHPERLCTDVCSYCFGKFGSLDTPCHLAQLKNSDRQSKILAIEVHLSVDSCLCDGCFRYVDRKANCPVSQRSRKPAARRGPLAGTICAVQDCAQPARHSVRRKWLIKLKKSIGKKLMIDMDKNPHLPFPLCSQHYYWVDYFTVCGICKKRLTRNHMYALGSEANDLNQALSDDGIPVRLSDKLFLCKLCRYYSSLRLKYRDPSSMSSTHRLFLNSYRKKILQYHGIPVSDSEEEGKCIEEDNGSSEPIKPKKKKSKTKSLDGHESKKRNSDKDEKSDPGNEDKSNDSQMIDYSYLDTLNVHRGEPTTPSVDYNSLGDFDSQVGFSNIASLLNPLEGAQGTVYPSDSQSRSRAEKPTRIQVKFGNLNIGKLSNLNIGQDTRPSSSATSAPERPPYLPGERELNLAGEFEFHGALNPSSSWERCTSTIQFDCATKKMWQELQRPYGNQSSFLRHLVILEKHWRNGSLVMSENPNPRAVKYLNSVRNRVQAYDGAKSSEMVGEKPSKPEVNVTLPAPPRPMSTPVKTTSAPPPLMKISPGSTPWLNDQLRRPPPHYSVSPSPTLTTHSRLVPVTAPPPYRFPSGARLTIRPPTPSPTYTLNSRSPQNMRPASMSYQQFKRIRLEKPPISASQVIISSPKVETTTTSTSTSSSKDFTPLICDVRSLATSTTTADWNESFRQQQQKMLKQNIAKYYAPILPKVPNSLMVTTFPHTTALVMKTSSLTIEKAPSDSSSKPTIMPPEKPSISVFRETTPSENS